MQNQSIQGHSYCDIRKKKCLGWRMTLLICILLRQAAVHFKTKETKRWEKTIKGLASGYLIVGDWGECWRRVGRGGAVNGRYMWGNGVEGEAEENRTPFANDTASGPHYKRLTFLLVFSILEGHAYSFGNRRFLHLFPTMELPLIGLPRTGVTLSLMAIRFA